MSNLTTPKVVDLVQDNSPALVTPEAVHFGKDDLPFVDIGGGNKLKVMQLK